jgi:Zn-dependent M32 family carboxypeptidase
MQQQEFLDNILSTIHEFGADLLKRYNLRLGAKALKSNLALKCTLFHLK